MMWPQIQASVATRESPPCKRASSSSTPNQHLTPHPATHPLGRYDIRGMVRPQATTDPFHTRLSPNPRTHLSSAWEHIEQLNTELFLFSIYPPPAEHCITSDFYIVVPCKGFLHSVCARWSGLRYRLIVAPRVLPLAREYLALDPALHLAST